ncbi:MAG: alpha-glucosidase [Clostridia bacterium]|nr:alpha-glucosidase [Clostridia bacterium]
MIRRYDHGTPYPSFAAVLDLKALEGEAPFLGMETEGGEISFTLSLENVDALYGLGEAVGPIDRRGRRYQSWNSDEFNHSEDRQSLYGSHNFLIVFRSPDPFALFLDDPGRVRWDLGFEDRGRMKITSENGDFSLYIITPEEGIPRGGICADLCRQFRVLTGRSYIPPRWALGYIQSRWGYAGEEDLTAVARAHRERHIPLDGICLDIDYMDGFRDFTLNREALPDLKGVAGRLLEEGVRVIPIIDAGVKKEKGYAVYDEGHENGFFCKKADGSDFEAAVWPGLSCFPDFFREDASRWFGDKYRFLLDMGVEGFWNDMNEPALFYSPEGLDKAFAEAEELRSGMLGHDSSFALTAAVDGIKNSMDDYRRFYHRIGDRSVRHDRVHNLYGALMTHAAAEGMRRARPGRRHLLFSRASFAGSHRDAGIWMGDNFSWWSHLALHLRMLPSLNMMGFIYCGADVGGFGADVDEELLIRWIQLGVFTPLFRNHSALGTRLQEVYRFPKWKTMRDAIKVRYSLIPWLYSEMMHAILSDGLLFRPLGFDYPDDPVARAVEDQVMLGRQCMIAPVLAPHVPGRNVYLPEDMLLVRFRTPEDFDTEELKAGWHYVPLNECEFPLFVRRGTFVILAKSCERTSDLSLNGAAFLGWDAEGYELPLYTDDGITFGAPDGHVVPMRMARGTEQDCL